ncbi:MAG: DUF1830 domain-containing protein [Pseudanabaena sp. CAN_BIN31]|nr:DUF1830 domain-containing protein [Pseudanabaena sp. CAN_BIN31]
MFNIQSRKVNTKNLENQLEQLTCIYRNESEFVQIIRISQPNISFFERSVFPDQCVQFSASTDALLEVCEVTMSASIHADTIPCSQIAILDTDMGRNLSVVKELCKDLLVEMAA